MAWSVIQSVAHTATGSPTSCAATFTTANLSSGTKLIAFVGINTYGSPVNNPSAVKDGSSNSFTNLGQTTGTAGTSSFHPSVSIWCMDTPAGDVGTKPTITATIPAGSDSAWILIQEVSGLASGTTASADGTAGVAGSQTMASSMAQPSYSSTAASELLYSIGCQDGVNSSVTQPTGYTLDGNSPQPAGSVQGQVSYKNSTGGAESGNWTWGGGTGGDTAFLVLAFKLAGGGTTVNGTATLTGAGTLTANAIQGAGLSMAAAGSLASNVRQGAGGSMTGAGALSVNVIQGAGTSLTGAGVVASNVSQGAGGSFTGSGLVSVNAVQLAVASLAGAGVVSANSGSSTGGSGSMAGSGVLTVNAVQGAGMSLSESGLVVVNAIQRAVASLTGLGVVSATSGGVTSGTGTLTGSGAVTVNAIQESLMTLIASGVLSVADIQRATVTISANGVLSISTRSVNTSAGFFAIFL